MGGATTKAAQARQLRDIVEELEVSVAVNAACIRFERAEDAWESLKFVLAHDPTVGTPETESGTIRSLEWHGARSAKLPSVVVLYRIDEPQVTILAVDFYEAPYEREGRA